MSASRPVDQDLRTLVCELLALFYDKGWVAGTGGGLCAATVEGTLLMAPTGVHKERTAPGELFVVDRAGAVVKAPEKAGLRLTECATIFCALADRRGAGSVMHSHALGAVLAGDLAGGADRLVIRDLEMLKGIRGCTNADRHAVPVVDNTAREPELVGRIRDAVDHPDFASAACVIVRNHGAYIWGGDIWEAKRHAEVYHFLFDAVIARSRRLP